MNLSTAKGAGFELHRVPHPRRGHLLSSAPARGDAAQNDAFFIHLEPPGNLSSYQTALLASPTYAANTRRQIPAVVSGVLQQAVLARRSPPTPSATWSASSPEGPPTLPRAA